MPRAQTSRRGRPPAPRGRPTRARRGSGRNVPSTSDRVEPVEAPEVPTRETADDNLEQEEMEQEVQLEVPPIRSEDFRAPENISRAERRRIERNFIEIARKTYLHAYKEYKLCVAKYLGLPAIRTVPREVTPIYGDEGEETDQGENDGVVHQNPFDAQEEEEDEDVVFMRERQQTPDQNGEMDDDSDVIFLEAINRYDPPHSDELLDVFKSPKREADDENEGEEVQQQRQQHEEKEEAPTPPPPQRLSDLVGQPIEMKPTRGASLLLPYDFTNNWRLWNRDQLYEWLRQFLKNEHSKKLYDEEFTGGELEWLVQEEKAFKMVGIPVGVLASIENHFNAVYNNFHGL